MYPEMNPNLSRLIDLLGRSMKPSHGYTIAESAPEVVTAPGVYFPSERGEVIPLQSRAEGGSVSPNSSDTEKEKLSILRDIISVIKPRQGMEARQFGGPVSPDGKPSLMDEIEKSKYDILKAGISALKPQKQSTNSSMQNPNMISRQFGGNVDPLALESLLSALTPGGRGPFSKGGGGGYGQRISPYGSPGWFGSEKEVGGGKPYSPFAPLPSPPNIPTVLSYGIKPEGLKSEGDLSWEKKRKEAGWANPAQDLWEHKREEGKWSMPMFSADKGAEVTPTEEDEYEKLRRIFMELNPSWGKPTSEEGIKAITPTSIVTPESLELSARERWGKPGYPEKRLEEMRKGMGPRVAAVVPGYEKTYYEAHPEEKLMDIEAERMRPLEQAMMKAIEDERTRQQGYGVGFGPTPMQRRLGLERKEPSQIPELLQGLMRLEKPTRAREAGRIPTPHYLQAETGEWVAYTPPTGVPPGVAVSTGVKGRKPTIEGFEEWKRIPGNENKTYEDYRKWETGLREKEVATSGLREFEIATGTDPSKRGTPEYSKSYMEFLGGKKQATTDPIQQKKLGTTLRKEFNSLQPVKDYRDIETRFNIMGKAIEESKTTKNFVAVDQALITIFNKMTDPQSVVRESEYLRTPQDLALWNRIKGKVSKMVAGGAGLTPDDRNALFSMARQFQGAYKSKFDQLRNEYRGYAMDYGLDPEQVIKSGQSEKPIEESDMDRFLK